MNIIFDNLFFLGCLTKPQVDTGYLISDKEVHEATYTETYRSDLKWNMG